MSDPSEPSAAAPNPEARREKHIKDQLETLGRFVQAFELMVDAARQGCMELMPGSPDEHYLHHIVFHHHALTAQPLFDIMRALMAQLLLAELPNFTEKDKKAVIAVLKEIARRYQDVVRKRNDLLHSTWHIGLPLGGYDDAINAMKFKATAGGLGAADLPQTLPEMRKVIDECGDLESAIRLLSRCFANPAEIHASELFKADDGRWTAVPARLTDLTSLT